MRIPVVLRVVAPGHVRERARHVGVGRHAGARELCRELRVVLRRVKLELLLDALPEGYVVVEVQVEARQCDLPHVHESRVGHARAHQTLEQRRGQRLARLVVAPERAEHSRVPNPVLKHLNGLNGLHIKLKYSYSTRM